jgi:hypothetical protein
VETEAEATLTEKSVRSRIGCVWDVVLVVIKAKRKHSQ